MFAEIEMSEDATGTIDSSNQTWDLDFAQTTGSWTVTMHIEGDYENN